MAVILKLSLLRIVFSVERNVIISCRVDSRVAYRLPCPVCCCYRAAH